MGEQKKKLENIETLDMQEIDLKPMVSRLTLNDLPKEGLELKLVKISQVKTNFGERIDFIGEDKNENPLQFSSWNITSPGQLKLKIGSKIKVLNKGTQKFFLEVL
jgi:hypothetical protein